MFNSLQSSLAATNVSSSNAVSASPMIRSPVVIQSRFQSPILPPPAPPPSQQSQSQLTSTRHQTPQHHLQPGRSQFSHVHGQLSTSAPSTPAPSSTPNTMAIAPRTPASHANQNKAKSSAASLNSRKTREDRRQDKYKQKCDLIQERIREIILINTATQQELFRYQDKLDKHKTQRRFLLEQLLQREKITIDGDSKSEEPTSPIKQIQRKTKADKFLAKDSPSLTIKLETPD